MSDLSIRLKTASFLLLALGLCLAYLPGFALYGIAFIIFNYAVFELLSVSQTKYWYCMLSINALLILLAGNFVNVELIQSLAIIFIFGSTATVLLFQLWQKKILSKPFMLLIGIFLIDAAFIALVSLYGIYGIIIFMHVCLSVMLVDAGGYVCGRIFGKHKLIPSVSPKKTWEGFCGSFVCLALYGSVLALYLGIDISLLHIFKLLLIFLAAVFGDLWFSYIKRMFLVKDYSGILPGHGGILDRIDSVIFVLPFFALFI